LFFNSIIQILPGGNRFMLPQFAVRKPGDCCNLNRVITTIMFDV
jgi:hypothetical protein